MQRKISGIIEKNGIGTKAQQAIKLDYENNKNERKTLSKERHEEEEELKFQKKQEKKRKKKKGH